MVRLLKLIRLMKLERTLTSKDFLNMDVLLIREIYYESK